MGVTIKLKDGTTIEGQCIIDGEVILKNGKSICPPQNNIVEVIRHKTKTIEELNPPCKTDPKYNTTEVCEIIENEGLGYAITSYISHDQIEDVKLADLWRVAKEVLDKIEEYVGD